MVNMMPPSPLYHSHKTIEVSYQTKLVPPALSRKDIYKTVTTGEVAYGLI